MVECEHETSKLTFKINSLGVKMYVNQCCSCGEKTSSWLEKKTVKNIWDAVPFDNELLERSRNRRQAEWRSDYEREKTERSSDWWRKYNEYLKTPKWKEKSRLVLKRDNFICRGCLQATAVHAHHLSYEHVGDEFLFELVAVCFDCHKKIHPDRLGQQ
jgi:5-methylcytosine-specific restriction endonuclease McrA